MFQNTRFVVDRFHYKYSHKCSEMFKMDRYSFLDGINSSYMESNNSIVANFRPQLSQMNQHSYMMVLKIILMIRNHESNEKLKFKIDCGIAVNE